MRIGQFRHIILFQLVCLTFTVSAQADRKMEVDALNDLSYDLGYSHLDSAYKVAFRAVTLAKKYKYIDGELTALCRVGKCFYQEGRFNSSLSWFNRAEEAYLVKGGDSIIFAKILVYQGLVLRKLGKASLALEKYKRSYDIALSQHDHQILGDNLINISNLYREQSNFSEALRVLNTATNHFPKEQTDQHGIIQLNIGNIYEDENRNAEALKAFRKAYIHFSKSGNNYSICQSLVNIGNIHLRQDRIDSASIYFERSHLISKKNNFTSLHSSVLFAKGELNYQIGRLDEAKEFYTQSLALKVSTGEIRDQGLIYERLGDLNLLASKPQEALAHYLMSYELSSELNNHMELAAITNKLATIYSVVGNIDEAFRFSKLSGQYVDSLSKEMSEALVYEIKFNEEKNARAKLTRDLKVQKLEISKQKSLILFLSIIGLLILLVLIIVFKLYKHRKKKIELEKNQILAQKEIDHLLNTQERIAINAMLDGQESERDRIAGELHDNLGASLSIVKVYFNEIDKQIDLLKEENIRQFQKANQLLDQACDDARKIAHDLSTGMLTKMGLFAAVKGLERKINDAGQNRLTVLTFGTDDNIKMLNEVAIYRIIQELVANALKYSQSNEITVQLNVFSDENLFNLLVEDDGIGFDLKQMSSNAGMGLRSVKARVENLKGTLEIDSVVGRGTSISIDIPINHQL